MIYILGGNGFVGSAFVRYCEQNDLDHEVITRENYDYFKNKSCSFFINANGNSKKYLSRKNPILDFSMNVNSTINSIFDYKYKQYIYLSSIDVYNSFSEHENTNEHTIINSDKLSEYGFSKYLAELCVRRHTENWMIFRLGGMIGKGLSKNPIWDILNNKPLRVHSESRYQYINTDLVASIVLKIISKNGVNNDIYNICGNGSVSLKSALKIINKSVDDFDKEIEHYEINNDKINKLFSIPSSINTLLEFIESEKMNL